MAVSGSDDPPARGDRHHLEQLAERSDLAAGRRANRPSTGKGYWEVAADGGIFSFGDATFFGSMGGTFIAQPVTGIAATPTGKGYWMVAGDGGIFSFGDAGFFGSLGGNPPPVSTPVVGIVATPTGNGYWMVSSIITPPTCQAGSLRLSFIDSSPAAGSIGASYGLQNTSSATCSLTGYPGLQLLGPSRPLPTTVSQSAAFPINSVGLVPTATGFLGITYPSQTGFGNLSCPTSSALGVTPPGSPGVQLVLSGAGGQIQAFGGTTQNLMCGQLNVTAIQPSPPF